MNERTRQLLKQASKLANTDDNKDFDRTFDMIVAEKFAQLIIEECCDHVRAIDAMEIKKHFGVER